MCVYTCMHVTCEETELLRCKMQLQQWILCGIASSRGGKHAREKQRVFVDVYLIVIDFSP